MRNKRTGPGRGKKPGYARVNAFDRVWQHISRLELDRVDESALAVVGVTGSGATECIAALRFLGIVGEDGAVTDAYRAMKTKDSSALATLVDSAYADLLRICPLPADSRHQLEVALRTAYGLKEGRMAMAAAALFAWVYDQTGRHAIADVDHSASRRKVAKISSHRERTAGSRAGANTTSGTPALPGFSFTISVHPGTTAEEIRTAIREIRAAWEAERDGDVRDGE
jgi:hypothetical protein